jgi:hypothetical protein
MVYLSIYSLGGTTLYDAESVPSFFIKAGSSGNIKIVEMGKGFVLYENDQFWMNSPKNNDSVIKQMYSSYDLAYGNVLVSGLGFGILALWLCSKPDVLSVTVVEFSQDVIKLFKDSNSIPDKLKIVNMDIRKYNTDTEYDAILLDHYEKETFDFILDDIEKISSKIKHKSIWAWPLEEIFLFKMYASENHRAAVLELLDKGDKDFSPLWNNFVDIFFPKEEMLKNISNQKLNEYIYTYFNKKYPGVDF